MIEDHRCCSTLKRLPPAPVDLGTRKHVLLDGALFDRVENAEFVVNPPRRAERVIDGISGSYRKHLTVVEDPDGLIRIYNSVEKDHLAVRVSRDGVHFRAPDELSSQPAGSQEARPYAVVIPEMVGWAGHAAGGPQRARRTTLEVFL